MQVILTAAGSGYSSILILVLMMVLMYVFMMVPQKKERKKKAALLASMSIGDSVRTTAGMFGTIIDISDDTVIIEFGNNKNCRIPMLKEAVVEVEKAENAVVKPVAAEETEDKKKKLFGKS